MQNKFIKEALSQAKIAFEKDEVPIGAVIVKNGEILAKAHNLGKEKNICAHAEILAIEAACENLGQNRLDGCEIYVSLEPCAMCAAAISLAKIQKLYYALPDKKFGAVENGIRFFSSNSCFFVPEIYHGFCEDESRELMQKFFQSKRQK